MNSIRVADGWLVANPRRLRNVTAAVGGFLIMMGTIMLGIFALDFFGILSIGTLMDAAYRIVFILALIAIGVFDIVSGLILMRE